MPLERSQGPSLARSIQSDQAMGLVLTAGLTIYAFKELFGGSFYCKGYFCILTDPNENAYGS